ncbi:DUF4907 domain-containing protein [Bacteroides oleiciplenus]|uniref:Uncharacterized protein n=1 Tax=Bacteroides oleiciplenus TaxID=626931 RepID=A0A3E5B4C4_9BACE|nr:DUF4907 domain-containing protein [Bacteroides oleiciplenus]RGN32334.1 hypothetical protein DXB65_18780 [Bacteroides oleiciplenus]
MKLMFIVKLGVLSVVAVCLSCCSGRKSAGSGEFAYRPVQVGGLVCRKLMEGQPPTVSREEIAEKLPFIHRLSGQ